MTTRAKESGVSLLNVLVIVAAGTGLVQVMLGDQDRAIDRLTMAADRSQARALAEAGVSSMRVALRRDLRDAPDSDHRQEAWATSNQQVIRFEFGTYEVRSEDLRGRFDLNGLEASNLAQQRAFGQLLAVLDLPQTLGVEITRIVAETGPLQSPDILLSHGLSSADLSRLSPFVTALPVRHNVNINAASETLLSALFRNPAAARSLVARRDAKGFLDQSDLDAMGLALPPLAGFTSDAFRVTAAASVGEARHSRVRLILRDFETGQVWVRPIEPDTDPEM